MLAARMCRMVPRRIVRAGSLACLVTLAQAAHAEPVRIKMEWGGGDRTKLAWDGQIIVEGGLLVAAENYLMDGGVEGFHELTDRSLKFRGLTEGGTDGLIITVDGPSDMTIRFVSPVKEFSFPLSKVLQAPFQVTANEQGASVNVSIAPTSSIKTPRQECRSVVADSEGNVWTVGIETDGPETSMDSRQKIVLGRWTEEEWEPVADLAGPGVLYFPAVAADNAGGLWVAWCQFEGGNWDVYARHFDGDDAEKPHRLTDSGAADLLPSVVVTSEGPVVAWQSGANRTFRIMARRWRGGEWGAEIEITDGDEMSFRPVLARAPEGTVWLAYDAFDRRSSDYDVFVRSLRGDTPSPSMPMLASDADEMDASAAVDLSGTVWVVASGKCVGLRAGQRLLPPTSLMEAARIGNVGPSEVAVDGAGRLWLFSSRAGGRNRQPIYRAALIAGGAAPVTGSAALAEGWRGPLVQPDGTVWHSTESALATFGVPIPRGYASSTTVAATPAPADDPLLSKQPAERRRHETKRVSVGGRELNVYYGELHTHLSELPSDRIIRSWVDRFYNNARYTAQLDIASVSDHDWPPMTLSKFTVEQAYAAVLNDPTEFAACVGWEWSGHGPTRFRYGDRTVVFLRDYSDILRITDERGNQPAKLHEFLRAQGAIDWPHHVGAGWAVMDWDTHSASVEPVVEMTSIHGVYETYDPQHAIAVWRAKPKQSRDDTGDKTSIQYGLSEGHRFGMVGSSDSHSGISGYQSGMLAVFAPELTREAVLKAWKARHAYALRGGERILVDFRAGNAFMGDEVTITGPPRLSVRIEGTAPLAKVEVIRNNRYVYAAPGNGRTLEFEYLDNNAPPGGYYYYLRVFQEGEAYAWSSPIWVTVQ
ncbi:MAG: hypothetical protein ACE5R4_00460 [Armatimonadota bacterium]